MRKFYISKIIVSYKPAFAGFIFVKHCYKLLQLVVFAPILPRKIGSCQALLPIITNVKLHTSLAIGVLSVC
jgi:hypothetical protein